MGMRMAVATVAAFAALGSPAEAGHLPAPVVTTTYGTQQGGTVWTSETSYDARNGCLATRTDGPGASKTPLRHDPSKGLVIRLARADKPIFVNVLYERVPSDGYLPFVTMSVPPFELRPVRARGKVTAWDVVLQPPGAGIPPPAVADFRIWLFGRWWGECKGEDQGEWRFHLLAL